MSTNTSREEWQRIQDREREENRKLSAAYDSDPLNKAFGAPAAESAAGDIPAAYTLDSDHMNAMRLFGRYGKKIIVIGGQFYTWDGTRYGRDEPFVARAAGQLPTIVQAEAKAAQDKYESLAAGVPSVKEFEGARRRDRSAKVESTLASMPGGADAIAALDKKATLERWAKVCEARRVQQNAIELLRSWLTFDASKLDADPALLNCWSGTINLRTGKLQPHSPLDYITKCAPVEYRPGAECPRFKKFLLEIMAGDVQLVAFLQSLFGYCATGETREQKLTIKFGEGANGKSTLLDAVRDVLGDYAATAPPGFLTGRGAENRHPTEVMDLMGRRLLTCNESDQGSDLREGHVKQLTGETVLKGRRMHQDFSEFKNTAKLVLSTNHKPVIQGADHGIWRRLLLVPFNVKFGTADEVRAGTAAHSKDAKLPDALHAEREGIFAWIVEGARIWYRFGLQPPESVLAATADYQSDSDRVKQFVSDSCVLEENAWVTVSELYQTYQIWTTEHGYKALGWSKFRDELKRVVPHFREDSKKQGVKNAGRKTVRGCYGLKLSNLGAEAFDPLPTLSSADGAPPVTGNEDLI